VSTNVNECTNVCWLPHASETVKVREIDAVWPQFCRVLMSTYDVVGAMSQVSSVVTGNNGMVGTVVALHSSWKVACAGIKVGGLVSTIVIVCVAIAMLPQSSVVIH